MGKHILSTFIEQEEAVDGQEEDERRVDEQQEER